MSYNLDLPEPSSPVTQSASDTSGELLSELGLSGRAIREILPDTAPAGARFDFEEFE